MNITIEQIRPESTWRLRRDVMYPDKKMFEMELDVDAEGYHFAAYQDDIQVGVISLFHEGDDFQFRKLAVADTAQGQGIGTILLNYVLDFAVNLGAKRIWCNARVSAIGFYERFGMKPTGSTYTQDNIDFEIMEKEL